ncbi:hypothetical protein OSSY52_00280 [Tepiditoga spiralis]|uniref:Mutator family transposase n=1 Tax=Tepiditoga spiralis TaxID=2108365 RepID=A0A7G1G4T3_9BACT|nr:transposase [Tepiditoga spiralis]BBE29887.1 hypothetical protein OSSY52_00280 [Tepiditoga spiralis]
MKLENDKAGQEIYTFMFMDGIVFKVKDDGEIIKKTAYVVLGVNIDGFKEVLGIYRWGMSSKMCKQ